MQQVLKISRKIDYALRAAIHLAGLPEGELVSHKDLAERLTMPADFTAKIMKTLAERGIVQAVRGAHGGFRLARAASDISMLDVIEAVEGPVVLNVCLGSKGDCAVSDGCGMYDVWRLAQARMVDVYRAATLATLARTDKPMSLVELSVPHG